MKNFTLTKSPNKKTRSSQPQKISSTKTQVSADTPIGSRSASSFRQLKHLAHPTASASSKKGSPDEADDLSTKVHAENAPEPVLDAFEQEFGAHFDVDGRTIRHNPTAIAHKVMADLNLAYSEHTRT